jgi:hypothetical protein
MIPSVDYVLEYGPPLIQDALFPAAGPDGQRPQWRPKRNLEREVFHVDEDTVWVAVEYAPSIWSGIQVDRTFWNKLGDYQDKVFRYLEVKLQ